MEYINISLSLPIVLYCYKILKDSSYTEEYLRKPCLLVKVYEPLTLLVTLMVIHQSGIPCLSHYQKHYYQECLSIFSENFAIYGADKLRSILMLLPSSMLTWKIFLLQHRLVKEHAPELLSSKYGEVADFDGMTMVSYSKEREGSEYGFSKRFRGRPLLQLAGAFIGNIFVDGKLFRGSANFKNFLPKAVKRLLSLGYRFFAVRADALYGDIKNLLFLEKLSLKYAIGIPTRLKAIKEGKKLFKKLARTNSSKIIHVAKGVAILSLGEINVANSKWKRKHLRHVILCRRIHRRKKKGKWKIKFYYYAIVSNLDWTPRKIYKFYMQRQCIENGFKTLRYHYHINNLCKNGDDSLKANELWTASKIFAMTLYKMFAQKMLSKRLRSKRRKTLIRELFGTTISHVKKNIVVIRRNHQHLWHLKRILSKLDQNSFLTKPFKIRA